MKYYSSFELTADNCLNNRAINYGDGVFETMLLKNHAIKLWDYHWHRLNTSLKLLGIKALDEKKTHEKVMSLVRDNGQYVLKLVVFRDEKKRGYSSQSKAHQYFITLNTYKDKPITKELTRSSIALSKQKELAGIKHLNRLEQILAAQELNQSVYEDAIMCDDSGCIIETISKNIILFKDDTIYSPKLNNCGVYGVALRWLQSQGHEINWKKIEFSDLAQYHGMMVCNSIQGFYSINNINDTIYFDNKCKIAHLIKAQWNDQWSKC